MNFVKFTEHNDNEGESWNFWLQLDGNEDALARLKSIVDLQNDAGYDEEYTLDMTSVPENEVDILVKHSDSGYMNYENKSVGKLTVPAFDDKLFEYQDEIDQAVFDWTGDNLYKGRVMEMFK